MPRAALLALVLFSLALGRERAGAQIPSPPHRVYGSVSVNGIRAADGTAVVALIGDAECGRADSAEGWYRLDVLAATMRPGCGSDGQTVRFRVAGGLATQTLVWHGASFAELDLSVQVPPFGAAVLDLTSPCIPAPATNGCDSARLRLWNGDQDAWNWLYRTLGAPDPPPDRVFEEVLRLRLEAGDPALVAVIARNMGWPYLKITAIRFRGSAPDEADEYVEVANLGGGSQLMTGWRIRAGGSGAEFRFQTGWTLAPGRRCRAYTSLTRPDSCPGFGFGSTFGLWDNDADTALLTVDAPAIIADRSRYAADPAAQPPAPALRGVNAAQ